MISGRLYFVALTLLATGAPGPARGLALNEPVPELRARDLKGNARTLADFPGRITVLVFWNPAMDRSRKAACRLAAISDRFEPGAFASVVSGPHEAKEFDAAFTECRRNFVVLLDPDWSAFGAYQITALPTAMFIAPDRRLKHKLAGFSIEGDDQIQSWLDEAYGRITTPAPAPPGPPDLIRRHGLAVQFLKTKMERQADSILEELTRLHPEFRPAWVTLAYRRIDQEQVEAAWTCFQKAVALGADNDVAPGLAWTLQKKGETVEAVKWAKRTDPNDPHAGLLKQVGLER